MSNRETDREAFEKWAIDAKLAYRDQGMLWFYDVGNGPAYWVGWCAATENKAGKLTEALREIAFMGLDAPAAMGAPGVEWYRSRAHKCISIAAWALDPAIEAEIRSGEPDK
jgi:hypothetical protein